MAQTPVKDTINFTGLHTLGRSKLAYFQIYMTLLLSSLPPPHSAIRSYSFPYWRD